MSSLYRIGLGWDRHRLVEDRPLILGGGEIPFEKGLAGHSDADVLCHAIIDSLLGALALGDIGRMYPDSDPRWEGVSSWRLLKQVYDTRVVSAGWKLGNLDATVKAQDPRLAPVIERIRQRLSEAFGGDVGSISVKAKTGEGLGPIGMGQAIEAEAVVLLVPREAGS